LCQNLRENDKKGKRGIVCGGVLQLKGGTRLSCDRCERQHKRCSFNGPSVPTTRSGRKRRGSEASGSKASAAVSTTSRSVEGTEVALEDRVPKRAREAVSSKKGKGKAVVGCESVSGNEEGEFERATQELSEAYTNLVAAKVRVARAEREHARYAGGH
jgi:hypothetical protein